MTGYQDCTDLEERVLAHLNIDNIVDTTVALVGAASENPGGTEQRTVDLLATQLRQLGASVSTDEVSPGRPNLTARLGGAPGKPGLLFLGHSDVVPPGEGWTTDPFKVRRDGDLLIGRGATDMKGGLAAAIAAMGAVHAEMPEVPMVLVCTVDEEADATGVRHYIETATPETFIGCIVAEPTSLVTITGCRGAMNLRVDIRGASAHAGYPSDGARGILAGAHVIAAIKADAEALAAQAHPVLGSGTWNVGTIEGGHGTSIVPDRCALTVDRRTLPNEDTSRISLALLDDARRRIVEDPALDHGRITVTCAIEMQMPGFTTSPTDSFVEVARGSVRSAGGSGDIGIWTAACEGGFMSDLYGAPTIILGPGDITGQAHQPNESVSVSEIHIAARAFALLAMRAYNHNMSTDQSADFTGQTPLKAAHDDS